jgi:hypothetical protein
MLTAPLLSMIMVWLAPQVLVLRHPLSFNS